jgi:opacity protein-like surface antigen
MSRLQSVWVIIAGTLLISGTVFAQEEETSKNEFTIQAFGSFVKSTTNNGVSQSSTNSGGVLGSYRFFFNQYNGVEANYGYSLNSQNFGLASGPFGVKTYSSEATAAYVFRYPLKHWTPFLLAGTGALVFDPSTAGISSQAKAAFVYGAGADISLAKHWFTRVEYRGFVYNSPDFGLAELAGTSRITHRAEPSIGFGYRF